MMRHPLASLLLAGSLVLPLLAAGPGLAPEYQTKSPRDGDGIGKVFLGREIAQVMGHQAAGWLERPEREEEERTDRLVEALALKPGEVVADIGAGSGYFSWRFAREVGPKGRVLAVDIQPEMLDLLMTQMRRRGVAGLVEPILGTVTDPRLPGNAVDLIILIDVYHELEFPVEMTRAMAAALKPGGRLVLVEYRGEDPAVAIKPLHKMTAAQVRRELAIQPLVFDSAVELLPQQRILIFRKPAGG
jgi:precorrin-6B methylase 2